MIDKLFYEFPNNSGDRILININNIAVVLQNTPELTSIVLNVTDSGGKQLIYQTKRSASIVMDDVKRIANEA